VLLRVAARGASVDSTQRARRFGVPEASFEKVTEAITVSRS
jgi:hypothetical protein